MKLQEAKDKAAQENEWSDWNHIEYSDIEQHEKDQIYAHLLDRVAELYAQSCAQEAREKAIDECANHIESGSNNGALGRAIAKELINLKEKK